MSSAQAIVGDLSSLPSDGIFAVIHQYHPKRGRPPAFHSLLYFMSYDSTATSSDK